MTKTKTKTKTRKTALITHLDAKPGAPEQALAPSQQPRSGSKQALVVGLLSRPEGSKLQDLIAATGWLPHTTRAALTGLRKRGLAIERVAGDGGSAYRIAAGKPEPQPEPASEPKRRSAGRRTAKAIEAHSAG